MKVKGIFEQDPWNAGFRICIGDQKSKWTGYEFIARLRVKGREFAGASQHWVGILPVETVFEIVDIDDSKYVKSTEKASLRKETETGTSSSSTK